MWYFFLQLCESRDSIHRFLGVLSPSAWSMRLCLQAFRMSTTFTELIFLSFFLLLVCRKSKLDWGSCSMLSVKYKLALIGKLLVWSRSVSVQPLENSGCERAGSKVTRVRNRGSREEDASVTQQHTELWRFHLGQWVGHPCNNVAESPLERYRQSWKQKLEPRFESFGWWKDRAAVNELGVAYPTTIYFWGRPQHWMAIIPHDGNVWHESGYPPSWSCTSQFL